MYRINKEVLKDELKKLETQANRKITEGVVQLFVFSTGLIGDAYEAGRNGESLQSCFPWIEETKQKQETSGMYSLCEKLFEEIRS